MNHNGDFAQITADWFGGYRHPHHAPPYMGRSISLDSGRGRSLFSPETDRNWFPSPIARPTNPRYQTVTGDTLFSSAFVANDNELPPPGRLIKTGRHRIDFETASRDSDPANQERSPHSQESWSPFDESPVSSMHDLAGISNVGRQQEVFAAPPPGFQPPGLPLPGYPLRQAVQPQVFANASYFPFGNQSFMLGSPPLNFPGKPAPIGNAIFQPQMFDGYPYIYSPLGDWLRQFVNPFGVLRFPFGENFIHPFPPFAFAPFSPIISPMTTTGGGIGYPPSSPIPPYSSIVPPMAAASNVQEPQPQTDITETPKRNYKAKYHKLKDCQLVCAFCRNNGWDDWEFHATKDLDMKTSCPRLRSYKCPRCGASGDDAHTFRYCPKVYEAKQEIMKQESDRRAAGEERERSLAKLEASIAEFNGAFETPQYWQSA